MSLLASQIVAVHWPAGWDEVVDWKYVQFWELVPPQLMVTEVTKFKSLK
jgi:hypothetical protein